MSADHTAALVSRAQAAFEVARGRLEELRALDPTFASDVAIGWVASLAVGFIRLVQLEDGS